MVKKVLVPITVPDAAYDATTWNGSQEVPTKNALRDVLVTIPKITVGTTAPSSPTTGDLWVDTN